jgi:acyl-CoA thioesterase-1
VPRRLQHTLLAIVLSSMTGAALGAEPAGAAQTRAASALQRTVLVLGDSLAVSPSPRDGFPAELQKKIARAGLDWTIVNAGVRGDTTAGGLARAPRLLVDIDVLVLALGSNDGLRQVPLATIERNLSSIIDMAKQRNIEVLLCGFETLPVGGNFDYLLGFHNIFPRLQQIHGVRLVPFLLEGVALIPELNGPDRIHPNTAGARRIADTVWPYLEPLLRVGGFVRDSRRRSSPTV